MPAVDRIYTGQAPGKLILTGEHAVVDGQPAIAVALPLLTTVTLREQLGASTLHASIDDDRLWPALLTVLPAEGLDVAIASALPVGCGLGSSAALAVATLRALNERERAQALAAGAPRAPADFAEVHRRAFAIERAFHGNPSGIDHAVSLLGGAVRYRRTASATGALTGPPEITMLKVGQPLTLVVVNTGKPAFTTAEMVAKVRDRGSAAELRAIGGIVEQISACLATGGRMGDHAQTEELGPLLNENHTLLQRIGVSTPALDAMCQRLRDAGATGAKLAGAGGGGVCFGVCTPDRAPALQTAATDTGFEAFVVTIQASCRFSDAAHIPRKGTDAPASLSD
jgi:mevalonate kinase